MVALEATEAITASGSHDCVKLWRRGSTTTLVA
jgi:hypothetical protein